MRRGTPVRKTTARFAVIVLLAVGSVGMGLYALAAQSLSAPSITSGPANPTNQTSATFAYTHNKSVSFQCSLDGSSFTACGTTRPSTTSYAGLTPGSHVFQVRAVSGAQTSAASSYPWTIDFVAPAVVSIDRSGANPTNAGSVAWTVTFSETVIGVGVDDFVLVNGGLTSPSIISVTGSGSARTVTASTGSGSGTLGLNLVDNDTVRDPASNMLGGPGTGNGSFTGPVFTIDKVAPPTPVFTQTPPDPSPTDAANFDWTDAEAGVSFQCSKENGAWFSCANPYTYTVPITNVSQHQFAVHAVDDAGNTSAVAAYSWKVSKLDFTIAGTVSYLYPAVWRSIAVTITNPNSYDINLSEISVGVSSSPAGCSASTNIEFQQSPISSSHTVTVPRNSTLTLAVADQPQIRLKNLPVNQDACKNGTFQLTYAGTGIH